MPKSAIEMTLSAIEMTLSAIEMTRSAIEMTRSAIETEFKCPWNDSRSQRFDSAGHSIDALIDRYDSES